MLRWRLLAAGGFLAPVLLLCWLDDQWNFGRPGVWLVPLAATITALGVSELLALLRRGRHEPMVGSAYLCSLLLIGSASLPIVWSSPSLSSSGGRLGVMVVAWASCLAIVFAEGLVRYQRPGTSTVNIALTLFVAVYVALPISFLVHLRLLHPGRLGILAVVSVLFVVKFSDVGAYFTGRGFGRRKLAPRLSPKKTVEGAVGGVVAGCIASWFYFSLVLGWLVPGPHPLASGAIRLLYGVTLSLAGILGDLAESLIKRDVGQKDSSRWLPGLGGVLDVMDSVTFAAPVAYLWWAGP